METVGAQTLDPTRQEFLESVLRLEPRVAAFDCDGTLWSGDAGSTFMHWTVETGLLSRGATDWIDNRYRRYKRGEVSELAICGEMVQVYHGLREDEMRRAAREFFGGSKRAASPCSEQIKDSEICMCAPFMKIRKQMSGWERPAGCFGSRTSVLPGSPGRRKRRNG